MPKRDHESAHGITEREQEVLARTDAGMPVDQVAAEVGVAASYVRHLIKIYAISNIAERQWRSAAIRSNGLYLAAIAEMRARQAA